MILVVYISFAAFVRFLFLKCVVLCTAAQIGRKTLTKGSCSSLHIVITKKQYLRGLYGHYQSHHNNPFKYCVILNNEGVLFHQSLKYLSKQV